MKKRLEALIRARERVKWRSEALIRYWRHQLEALRRHPQSFTMYDSTEVDEIPATAEAVAGYVGGNWPTYGELIRRFPRAKKLSIAIAATEDAHCLDIETGDATPGLAPAWVRRQHARHVARPVLYANRSTMPAVKAALRNNGIRLSEVLLWVAEYGEPPRAHIPAGYDACQWTDKALGRNLDASLCRGYFL